MPDRDLTAARSAAWNALASHTWWTYRACAPAPTAPDRSRADRAVPLSVWLTTDGEGQKDRYAREEQAVRLCNRCPVRAQCLAYALGAAAGQHERWDIWGGLTAHQRGELLKARRRQAAARAAGPVTVRGAEPGPATGPVLSALDQRVLQALAAHRAAPAVAAAAGLTLDRANWHRSKLVTALRLDPCTTTRTQLLYAARTARVLDPRTPILTDRAITAAVPSRQAAVVRSRGVQLQLPGMRTLILRAARTPAPAPALHLVPTPTVLPAAAPTTVLAVAA